VLAALDGEIRPSCFNILPLGLLEHLRPRGELFISTWALSESSVAAQDSVASHWFGAPRLLLASQESSAELPDAGRLPGLAKVAGASNVPVAEVPGSVYSFR
jgi:hypothetical protein